MKYPYDLQRKLEHAVSDGTPATQMEQGIARMAQRENGRNGRGGKWYAGRRIDGAPVLGARSRYQLLGEELQPDGVTRKWVTVLGRACSPTYYRCGRLLPLVGTTDGAVTRAVTTGVESPLL